MLVPHWLTDDPITSPGELVLTAGTNVRLDSTLQDLDLDDFQMEITQAGIDLIRALGDNPLLPGAILTQGGQYVGMISRQQFLTVMSRPYSMGIFAKRPLQVLTTLAPTQARPLPGDMPIFEAVRKSLERPPTLIYEPLVVEVAPGTYRILDLHRLLVAEVQIYQMAAELLRDRTVALDQANAAITDLNHRLQAENVRLSAELGVAQKLQQMVLPKAEELMAVADLDVSGFMEPADEVGGDYYDVLTYGTGGPLKIGIGDVTGHGLESGVLMLMVQTAVRTLQECRITDPVQFFDVLNRTIYSNVARMNSDKNMTLALVDYDRGCLRLSGQHEEMLVIRAGGEIETIDTIDLGFPIGLDEEIAEFVGQHETQLSPGDIAVLYTDGITEAENLQGEQYGLERLAQVVRNHRDLSAGAIKDMVIQDVHDHIGNQRVFDDITLLVLKQRS